MKNAFAAFLLAVAMPHAAAQTSQPGADMAILLELLAVSGTEKQYDQMMAIMLQSMRGGFNQGFAQAIKDKAIDQAKRERAQAIADRHFNELQNDLTSEMRRVMPYEKLVNEVYGPLYLQAFTRAEIEQAIAFYKSPTGRKMTGAAPKLMADASLAINQRYLPLIAKTIGAQMETRMKRMIDELSRL